ncbi:TPA: threonine--tRNA ligase [archaeon]|uniref:Threonine--tRNA ligase n=1 Tax=Candidatus Naiadarchaeum limnaeum TaxID=2756139 RepID=A0A832V3N2_9ARCH|nr:threonine--tRNA ligase [Candidatus Naiadarchaeales archaeon SRR2090153.bin1042]HIK00402.1 threonine--tRNA ligase [Candidatus Naiadarchaeum limnaeum]
MKTLLQHVDYIRYEVTRETKLAQKISEKEKKGAMEECLFVRFASEKSDEGNEKEIVEKTIADLKDVLKQINCKKVFLYPYVHLLYGTEPSSPQTALKIMDMLEEQLKKEDIEVEHAPFGYYKMFEMKCKGHPLSELSRVITAGKEENPITKKLAKQTARIDKEKLSENDHRILGPKLGLFSFQEVGPGTVFFHNKGMIIRNKLIEFWRAEHKKADYQEINTPIILDKSLWQVSGHWEHYKDLMFFTKDEDREFALKPMNCPGAILVYKSSYRSYRELPLRLAELGLVNRNELSGVLAGLFRLRSFTQDDAHIFATEEQVEGEIERVVKLTDYFYKKFGFEYYVELSTRPEKSMGTDEQWKKAEKGLEDALKNLKLKYKVNKGEGAFYGPKIDFHIKDSLGRNWQCATVQVDFQQPQRFDLSYVDRDGKQKMPVIIHRVIYGSIERFIGILVEHYKGAFPLWLAPAQVTVLSMSDKNVKYAEGVRKKLEEAGLKVISDFEPNTIDYKVRNAELQKINYILVCGEKEEEKKTIAVRSHKEGKVQYGVKIEEFVKDALKQIEEMK